MSGPIPVTATVDIGNGRGRLAPGPAASLARIDAHLGRPADVNDAWRSPAKADANYAAWLWYQRGGPWAPYALPASQSIHCRGYAVDSDDWYDPDAAAVWRRGGWRQTARYPGNPKKDEPWHGEYFEHLDELRREPAPAGEVEKPLIIALEEDDMKHLYIEDSVDGNGIPGWALLNTRTGGIVPMRNDPKDPENAAKNQKRAESWARVWGNARRCSRQDMLNAVDAIKKTNAG